jgi:hypothetical protein
MNSRWCSNSTYQFLVITRAGRLYLSRRGCPIALQPAGRADRHAPGSYGGNFAVAGTGAGAHFDVPTGPRRSRRAACSSRKVANKATAEVGDFVDYVDQAQQRCGGAAAPPTVVSDIAAGRLCLRARQRRGIDGAVLADPAGGAGPQPAIRRGQPRTGRPARADATACAWARAARAGNGINTAQAASRRACAPTASSGARAGGGRRVLQQGLCDRQGVRRLQPRRRAGRGRAGHPRRAHLPGRRHVRRDG